MKDLLENDDAGEPMTKIAKLNKEKPCQQLQDDISYVEFYSGIGGWTMALDTAVQNVFQGNVRLRRIAALDHSDLCNKVFQHNFGSSESAKTLSIERLTKKQVEEWAATVWVMSPPCQPHTRQHSNQSEDINDPRSKSFLHLIDLLQNMQKDKLPTLVFLENVVGFELSESFKLWDTVLRNRQYRRFAFHLTPTQVDLPNDRPRYFSIAILESQLNDDFVEEFQCNASKHAGSGKDIVWTSIPVVGLEADSTHKKLPIISSFLDDVVDRQSLQIPAKMLKGNAGWCLDIVSPNNRRSSCFTSAYGRFNRGTGSVLYEDSQQLFDLIDPQQRKFVENWNENLDFSKLRYFSGNEMARLMGFKKDFSFPNDCSLKQQWKLIGNSLNVRVASKVVELGLGMMMK